MTTLPAGHYIGERAALFDEPRGREVSAIDTVRALATAASEPGVVYAMMESKQGVLWRSDDHGDSWRLMSSESRAISRPFYYTDMRVDPTDENTLYAVAGSLMKSIDAGRTWTTILPLFSTRSTMRSTAAR